MLFCTGVYSCKEKKSSNILSPQKMEEVLYDYHLAKVICTNRSGYSAAFEVKTTNYVYLKHHINQAVMDSSLAYYTRNIAEMNTIYEHLSLRFKQQKDSLEKRLAERENVSSTSISGDSVDVWYLSHSALLTPITHRQKISFELVADSTYHPGDSIVWRFLATQLPLQQSFNSVMGLAVKYMNDSILSATQLFSNKGHVQLSIYSNKAEKIRSISGFVYLPVDSMVKMLHLDSIQLKRYHRSIPLDSLDSTSSTPKEKKAIRSKDKKKTILELPKEHTQEMPEEAVENRRKPSQKALMNRAKRVNKK